MRAHLLTNLARRSAMADQPHLIAHVMDGREDPLPKLDTNLKRTYLEAVVNLFGERWLQRIEHHPLRTLWHRKDWLSTLELYNLGWALTSATGLHSQSWRKALRRDMCGIDHGNAQAVAFELTLAAGLHHAGQQSRLAKPDQPGYDLVLTKEGHDSRLLISCKVLRPAAHERDFLAFATATYELTREWFLTSNLNPLAIHMFAGARLSEHCRDAKHIAKQLQAAVLQGAQKFGLGEWLVLVAPDYPFSGARFADVPASLAFSCAQTRGADEARRFRDKLQDGFANMAKQCPPASQTSGHIVAIKLPDWISNEEAEQTCMSLFAEGAKHISAVAIYRSSLLMNNDIESVKRSVERPFLHDIPRKSRKKARRKRTRNKHRTGTSVGFMFNVFHNPKATHTMNDLGFSNLQLRVGYGTIMPGPPRSHMVIGDEHRTLTNTMVYARREHYYRINAREPGQELHFHVPMIPGTRFSLIPYSSGRRLPGQMELAGCDDDRLILL